MKNLNKLIQKILVSTIIFKNDYNEFNGLQ